MDFDREWSMYSDGEPRSTETDRQLTVSNPATGERIASVPVGEAAAVDLAVSAARTAFEEWRWTAPTERAALLRSAADVIEDNYDELVRIETLENGKPIGQSETDVSGAASYFRFYAGATDKFYGDTVRETPDKMTKKVFEPYGVVGIIIPWNWPPLHTGQFLAMVLSTGNTAVLKPSPETPLSSLRIAELLADVFPPGTINVVPGGTEAGVSLTEHDDVSMIAFTGNDKTGEQILQSTARRIVPAMLELGGKNPEIVFPDADIEKAVSGAVRNSFYNSGQACSDTERLLLHEEIYDEFLDCFAAVVEDLVVGDGREETTQIGPLINARQAEKVQSYLDLAVDEGGTVVAQADKPRDSKLQDGHFVPPTVFEGLSPGARTNQEEIFGPVVSVIPFDDESEAIEIANDVDFGLTATVWTSDLNRTHRLVSRLEAGTVSVNDRVANGHALPFGGYKRSGVGRKSDFTETMRQFTRVKSVNMDFTDTQYSL